MTILLGEQNNNFEDDTKRSKRKKQVLRWTFFGLIFCHFVHLMPTILSIPQSLLFPSSFTSILAPFAPLVMSTRLLERTVLWLYSLESLFPFSFLPPPCSSNIPSNKMGSGTSEGGSYHCIRRISEQRKEKNVFMKREWDGRCCKSLLCVLDCRARRRSWSIHCFLRKLM